MGDMPDRTINWGDSETEASYRTQDDDPAGGGNFVVVEDLDGNLIPLQYNPTSGALETAVPIDTGSNDITTTGEVSAGTLEADKEFVPPVVATEADLPDPTNVPVGAEITVESDPNGQTSVYKLVDE